MNGRSEYMKYYFDKMYKDSAEKFYSLIKDNLLLQQIQKHFHMEKKKILINYF